MVDWREIFQQKAFQAFGQYAQIYLCDNGTFGDYYSNIALRCKAHAAIKDFVQDLVCLREWVDIEATASGLINFKLTTQGKLTLLQRWQKAHLQLSPFVPPKTTW